MIKGLQCFFSMQRKKTYLKSKGKMCSRRREKQRPNLRNILKEAGQNEQWLHRILFCTEEESGFIGQHGLTKFQVIVRGKIPATKRRSIKICISKEKEVKHRPKKKKIISLLIVSDTSVIYYCHILLLSYTTLIVWMCLLLDSLFYFIGLLVQYHIVIITVAL